MGNAQSLQIQKAVPMVQRVTAAGSVGVGYSLVGSVFGSGVIMLIIVSTLDQDVQISLDGTHDFMPVLSNSAIVLDMRSDGCALPGDLAVYVKQIGAPASGNLYVSGIQV